MHNCVLLKEDFEMNITKKAIKYVAALMGVAVVAFGLSRITTVSAQSSTTVPSGTFSCLINANYSGYVTRHSTGSDAQAVNALLVFTFGSTTPNTGTLVASVINNVSNFERPNPTTATSTSLPYPVAFTLTQVTAAQNVYRLVSDTPGDVPYYIAVVNSGNSLLFMSAPSDDKVHNGACQKV
jgi:hypothetical protein